VRGAIFRRAGQHCAAATQGRYLIVLLSLSGTEPAMPQIELASLAALSEWVDQPVPPSDWLEITQDRINQFAQATGDDQWIHVDPERA
jgi:hypothetical protein